MSPVVGKALEATIIVFYIGLVTVTLYGGVVPEYRASAGDEVAERTVANAVTDIESAIPPTAEAAETSVEIDLPATIAGEAYRIHAEKDTLVLAHPSPEIAADAPLVVPDRVVDVSGTWQSGDATAIHITTTEDGLEVQLV